MSDDFDPSAYLAEKNATPVANTTPTSSSQDDFDPKAYLAQKQQPISAPVDTKQQAPKQSITHSVIDGIKSAGETVKDVGMGLVDKVNEAGDFIGSSAKDAGKYLLDAASYGERAKAGSLPQNDNTPDQLIDRAETAGQHGLDRANTAIRGAGDYVAGIPTAVYDGATGQSHPKVFSKTLANTEDAIVGNPTGTIKQDFETQDKKYPGARTTGEIGAAVMTGPSAELTAGLSGAGKLALGSAEAGAAGGFMQQADEGKIDPKTVATNAAAGLFLNPSLYGNLSNAAKAKSQSIAENKYGRKANEAAKPLGEGVQKATQELTADTPEAVSQREMIGQGRENDFAQTVDKSKQVVGKFNENNKANQSNFEEQVGNTKQTLQNNAQSETNAFNKSLLENAENKGRRLQSATEDSNAFLGKQRQGVYDSFARTSDISMDPIEEQFNHAMGNSNAQGGVGIKNANQINKDVANPLENNKQGDFVQTDGQVLQRLQHMSTNLKESARKGNYAAKELSQKIDAYIDDLEPKIAAKYGQESQLAEIRQGFVPNYSVGNFKKNGALRDFSDNIPSADVQTGQLRKEQATPTQKKIGGMAKNPNLEDRLLPFDVHAQSVPEAGEFSQSVRDVRDKSKPKINKNDPQFQQNAEKQVKTSNPQLGNQIDIGNRVTNHESFGPSQSGVSKYGQTLNQAEQVSNNPLTPDFAKENANLPNDIQKAREFEPTQNRLDTIADADARQPINSTPRSVSNVVNKLPVPGVIKGAVNGVANELTRPSTVRQYIQNQAQATLARQVAQKELGEFFKKPDLAKFMGQVAERSGGKIPDSAIMTEDKIYSVDPTMLRTKVISLGLAAENPNNQKKEKP